MALKIRGTSEAMLLLVARYVHEGPCQLRFWRRQRP